MSRQAVLDKIMAKAISRKLFTFLTATGLMLWSDLSSDTWGMIAMVYIGTQGAIDAMKDTECGARKLTISTRLHTVAEVALRVADSGPGITPDHALAMFDAFNTTKNDGMGLGLTICRSIAERHNGRLIFEQVQPRGAALSLVLPVAQGQSEDEQ